MKQSEFNYVVDLENNMHGVFNTYKNSLVVLTDEELDHLNNLERATEEEIKSFSELEFIVEDDRDERAETEADTFKYANDDRVIVRILTTLICNANCHYCYENRTSSSMTTSIADDVVDFLRQINTKIHIEWFGGEPQVNHIIITYICKKLYEYGVDFTTSMVSNGILPFVNHRTHYWKLQRIQITLDGVGERYEQIKGVNHGSFDAVIENIDQIIKNKVDVSIRLNYTGDNMDDLKSVIDYMAERFGYNEYLHYYGYPIFQLCNDDKEFDPEYVDKIFELHDYIISKGLDTSKHLYTIKHKAMGCFATHRYGYTIGPDGKLFGCSHVLDKPIGDVVNGDNENRPMFLANVPEKCKSCIIYPLCKGGCKVGELGLGKINQCNLYKNRFDELVKRMIQNKLKEVET